jgi:hypothetical protein
VLFCAVFVFIFTYILFTVWPPLWSSGQSSCLQIQRSGFGSQRYQVFWEVVGLERGPLNLVSTTEELLERKSSGFGLEIREYGRRDPSRWPRSTLYPQKVALISPTNGGRSVGIVRSRTQNTEFFYYLQCGRILHRVICTRLVKLKQHEEQCKVHMKCLLTDILKITTLISKVINHTLLL